MFVASKPGEYIVTPVSGTFTNHPIPRTITVEGTAVETTAAETTVTETTTAITTKPSETSTESEETSAESETTSTETNANLIHGVVPTKVTAHIIGCSVPPGESVDAYMEFWNVGQLGGEQYSKAILKETITNAENITNNYTSEGYFTGGPNGLFHLTLVSEGGTATREFGLFNGKVINPGYIIPVDNPEAFDGWTD